MTDEMKAQQSVRDKASNALIAAQSDTGAKSQWQKKKDKKKNKDGSGWSLAAEWWQAESA